MLRERKGQGKASKKIGESFHFDGNLESERKMYLIERKKYASTPSHKLRETFQTEDLLTNLLPEFGQQEKDVFI